MSTNENPRPEKFDDLIGYDAKPRQLASIELEPVAVANGLLVAVDEFVNELHRVYGRNGTTLTIENATLVVARGLTDEEKQAALEKAQKDWDTENEARLQAEALAGLAIGDKTDAAAVGYPCRSAHGHNCDLRYNHYGDHVEIVDGRVASRTPRGGQ